MAGLEHGNRAQRKTMKRYETALASSEYLCYNIAKGIHNTQYEIDTKQEDTMNALQTTGATLSIQETGITAELFQRWVSYLDAKERTVQSYTKNVKRFLQWLMEQGITNPSREDVISYRESLKADHKPTTVQAYIIAVRQFFKWTGAEGLYPDISAHVKGAKLDRNFKKDYLTSRQAGKLIGSVERETLKGKRDYALLALMLTTGLRTIEVIRADVKDIATVGDDTVLFLQGKGRDEKNEFVKLEPHAEEALREYLAGRADATPESPLFASVSHRNTEQRMTTRSISRIVKERLISVNLKSDRLTAHSLRHTAATLNMLNGGTPQETQQLLRHSNISTTMIYSHALERAKNNSEKRIGKAIFG